MWHKILPLLACFTLLSFTKSQVNLANNYDCQQWIVTPGPLEPPVVTRTAKTITITNPSFTRSSYPFVQTDMFPVPTTLSTEPGLPRIRFQWRASTNLPKVDETIGVCIHQQWVLMPFAQFSTQDDYGCIEARVTAQPVPITQSYVYFSLRLAPRQSYTFTWVAANIEDGPTVTARMNPNLVSIDIGNSGHGGNSYGFIWSPNTYAAPVPVPGFAGVGLLVAPDIILLWPVAPVISQDKQIIALLRLGHWQAIETSPVPALGWPLKG